MRGLLGVVICTKTVTRPAVVLTGVIGGVLITGGRLISKRRGLGTTVAEIPFSATKGKDRVAVSDGIDEKAIVVFSGSFTVKIKSLVRKSDDSSSLHPPICSGIGTFVSIVVPFQGLT